MLPEPSCRPFTLLVVDDHELVRLGLRALLQAQGSPSAPTVILEAGSLAEGLALYERTQPAIDVVLLDLSLPDTRDMEGVATFHERFPAARLVVISGIDAPSQPPDWLTQRALAAGACAFLPKTANLQEVKSFVRACGLACSDGPPALPLPPEPTAGPAQRLAQEAPLMLSPRHLPVFQLVLEGLNNREIAEQLQLREGTVKNYVSTILLRLGIRSRAQLISRLR